jgi:hypothetical protein
LVGFIPAGPSYESVALTPSSTAAVVIGLFTSTSNGSSSEPDWEGPCMGEASQEKPDPRPFWVTKTMGQAEVAQMKTRERFLYR